MILIAIRALHSHATVNWARKIDAAAQKPKYCIGIAACAPVLSVFRSTIVAKSTLFSARFARAIRISRLGRRDTLPNIVKALRHT
jgi:hypothetical protein